MIKKITYVDFGYMPNSLEVFEPNGKRVSGPQYLTDSALFRIGWVEENKLCISFYSADDIVKILHETESYSIMNLIGREVNVENNVETGPRIVNFLK
jgi:hypothetical protein